MIMMGCRYQCGLMMIRRSAARVAVSNNIGSHSIVSTKLLLSWQSTVATTKPSRTKKKTKSKGTTTKTTKEEKNKKTKTKNHQQDGERNRDWLKSQHRKKRLHPAAQWKRILSHCDYWWSATNLSTDDFLKTTLRQNDGWCPVPTLLTFRSFQHWITSPLTIVDALTSSGATSKWRVQERSDSNGKLQWYVRRTTVTAATLDQLDREQEQSDLQAQNQEEEEEETSVHGSKRRQLRSLPLYTLSKDTEIIVVKKPSDLASLCDKLQKAMQLEPNSKMLALDVEYATLELDIRRSLPAMLQLATPKLAALSSSSAAASAAAASAAAASKIIGLIWLHKFPHFGQTILNPNIVPNPDHFLQSSYTNTLSATSTNSRGGNNNIMTSVTDQHFHEYEPLRQLLADSSIAKVGLGIHQDVTNLLRWWRIPSKDQTYFVTHLVDLKEESFGHVDDSHNSLQDICGTILKQQLLKDKTFTIQIDTKGNKKKMKKKKKSQRTKKKIVNVSHWRAKNLTEAMKVYSAQDVAAVVDIYNKLKLQQQLDTNKNF